MAPLHPQTGWCIIRQTLGFKVQIACNDGLLQRPANTRHILPHRRCRSLAGLAKRGLLQVRSGSYVKLHCLLFNAGEHAVPRKPRYSSFGRPVDPSCRTPLSDCNVADIRLGRVATHQSSLVVGVKHAQTHPMGREKINTVPI